jgi:hypothetical protein
VTLVDGLQETMRLVADQVVRATANGDGDVAVAALDAFYDAVAEKLLASVGAHVARAVLIALHAEIDAQLRAKWHRTLN